METDNQDGHSLDGVQPFWRAVAGGAFGAIVGGVWIFNGFLWALLMLVLIIIGAVVGAIAAGPSE